MYGGQHVQKQPPLMVEQQAGLQCYLKPKAYLSLPRKDDLLKEAVRQRWEKDARFRTIVEAAKQQSKTLLFYTGSASSEYGGKRTQEGYLEGENKLGKAMMEIAGFI